MDNPLISFGAGGRNRTDMPLRAEDFESGKADIEETRLQ